ncbi:MAG: secretin N-terminal domain-containing protein [Chthoniobacteraceae bacterium]
MQSIRIYLILAVSAVVVWAQEPRSTPIPVPQRVIRRAGPETAENQPPAQSQPVAQPAAAPSAEAAASSEDFVPLSIDFPNTDVRGVFDFYQKITGKRLLYDNTVQGNISIRVGRISNKEEAIRILETAFSLNSFILIPGPGDIVKVIGSSKNVRQFDIPIFSELDQLPTGNQVVSFLFTLNYADPRDIKAALDQVVAATPSITNIVPLQKSQAVLVTENASMIRNLAPIVAKLDCKPADVVSAFIPLERADAKEVVEKLTKMFEKTPSSQGAPAAGGQEKAQPDESRMIVLSEDSVIVGKIRIEADLRTNRVHVITRPANLAFLRSVIADLDCGISQGEPATRSLRFVLAGDVLDVVAGAVAEPGVEVKKLDSERSASSANAVNNSTGNLSSSGTSSSTRTSSRSSSVTSGSFGANNNTLQTDTAPEGRIIRNTKIIADNRTNTIIIVGNDEVKRKIFDLLDKIDVRAPQVLLTAVIGELTLDDDEEFGVDYLFNKGNLSNAIGSGTLPWTISSAGASGSNLKNVISASSLPSTGGGVSGLIGVSNSLDVFVSALQSTGRYRITSRPMIFTGNNRPAVISSGESIPVPSSTTSGYTSGTSLVSTSSVDYIDVVLRLSVLPLINSDGEVTLQITQDDNNTNGTTTISGNAIPNVTTRRINTTVSVANEATIVLGGLVSEKKDVSVTGVPGLSKIPVLGSLFSYKKNKKTRTELIVLIRPTVTRGPVQAVKTGERAVAKTHFPPDLDASLDPPAGRKKVDVLDTTLLGLPEK